MADSSHEQYEVELEEIIKELVQPRNAGYIDAGIFGFECCKYCGRLVKMDYSIPSDRRDYPHAESCLIARARRVLRN